MSGRGLLSRLGSGDGALAPPPELQESIVHHLRVLLNTRRGEGVTVPDFGLVDFTDLAHQFPAAVQTLQQSIRATLQQYEPRLKNVVVRHTQHDDPLVLRFEISGQLAERGARVATLRFSTLMSPGGGFQVW